MKKYKFDKLNISTIISECLKCNTKEESKNLQEQYEQYCDTPEIACSNLGYIFGYCDEKDRTKLYKLFSVNHPMFGEDFGRGKEMTTSEMFIKGLTLIENNDRTSKKQKKKLNRTDHE